MKVFRSLCNSKSLKFTSRNAVSGFWLWKYQINHMNGDKNQTVILKTNSSQHKQAGLHPGTDPRSYIITKAPVTEGQWSRCTAAVVRAKLNGAFSFYDLNKNIRSRRTIVIKRRHFNHTVHFLSEACGDMNTTAHFFEHKLPQLQTKSDRQQLISLWKLAHCF